jgi:exosortase A
MIAPVSSGASGWQRAGLIVGAAFLLAFVLFWPTFMSMVEVWERSETFAHGYTIFPISLWLIWRRREALARMTPRADARGLAAMALAAAGWLLSDAGSVNVVAQYAFIALLISSAWAILGWAVVWALFFPLMFLFFAVPVGEFLIQPLMGVTADFTVAMLQFTGIPVYREGTFFSIPSGDWSVVEGCSGLRYLIASITLGVLYAYLTYRSWKRRLLFSLAALVVPIFANSGRAYMIVMIAHLSDMKLALGVDHYIYGWVFFGFVMLLLFWIGSFWREDDQPEPAAPAQAMNLSRVARLGVAPAAGVAALLIAVAPLYATWLASRPLPAMPTLTVAAAAGWQPAPSFTPWVPHWVGADRQVRVPFVRDLQTVMLEINYYATQRQDAELVNSQNFMIRQKDPQWSNVGESLNTVDIAGQPHPVRQAKMRGADGQRLLVWQWNVVNGRPTVNDLTTKLVLAFDRVRGARDDGASVLIATPYDDVASIDTARVTLARFAADMQPAITRALAAVEAP